MMVKVGETASNLAELLALHREAIVASMAQQVQELPATHYQTLPLDEFQVSVRRGIDALIADIQTHSDASLEQYAFDLGRWYLAMGFDISEVIEAILLFKETVLSLIWGSLEPGSPEAYHVIHELDAHGRHTVAFFGHHYADMMQRRTLQHLAESQSLQRVTTALLEKRSLEDVLTIVCTEAQTLTGAKGSAVFLVEEENWLRNAFSIGEVPFTVERLPIQGSFNGMVVCRGEACLSNNPAAEAHRFMAATEATSVLVVPLRAKGVTVGALDIANKPGGFAEDDLRIMNLFADQAAIAIENARLARRLEQLAVVEERQRLARDLHDSVTQTLYSATLYADAALWSLEAGNNSAASTHLREVQESSREALREMRLLIFELHPPELETEGLTAALQARLGAVEARTGFKADFRVEGERRLPLAVEETLYRIAQEALNNVFKHASAHQVAVALRFSDHEVSLEVGDDGVGFDPAVMTSQGGLGLRGMQERIRKVQGTLHVDSAPGRGTRVCVTVDTHDLCRDPAPYRRQRSGVLEARLSGRPDAYFSQSLAS